jgi:hypothetical protein
VFIPELIVTSRIKDKCESLSILKYSVDAEYRNLRWITTLLWREDAWGGFGAPAQGSANDSCWLGCNAPQGASPGHKRGMGWCEIALPALAAAARNLNERRT